MPAACRARTIILNSLDGVERRCRRGVARLRGEEAERVVAPVVASGPCSTQVAVVDVVVDRQQLDGGDAEARAGAGWPPRRPGRRRCRAASRARPGCSLVKPLTCSS